MSLSRNPRENLEKSIEALQNIQSFLGVNNEFEENKHCNKLSEKSIENVKDMRNPLG
ncbi:hypothetical protein [Clostridium sp.]|uniref:hypothetical protein n=1 Tax=Clostridium sp. TaxID=1506 RepID=UPI002FC73195